MLPGRRPRKLVTDQQRQRLRHRVRLLRVESGDQHVLARPCEFDHGIAEVGEREIRQLTQRLIEAHAIGLNAFEKLTQSENIPGQGV